MLCLYDLHAACEVRGYLELLITRIQHVHAVCGKDRRAAKQMACNVQMHAACVFAG